MLKPTPSKVVSGLLAGFCLILIAAWLSGATQEICQETKSGHEQCAPYNLAPFILIQIREGLHSIEGIITALATIAIAAFTWTLYQSSEKMWGVAKISAEATKINADVLLATQRPHMYVDNHEIVLHTPGGGDIEKIAFRCIWKNFGYSPATDARVVIRTVIHQGNGVPEVIFDPSRLRVAGNVPRDGTINTLYVGVSIGEAILAWQNKLRIFLYTRAEYGDFLKKNERYAIEDFSQLVFLTDPRALKMEKTDLGLQLIGTTIFKVIMTPSAPEDIARLES